jgi:hypothetical protein
MSQTRKGSWTEVAANIAVGYSVNFLANMVILPLVGLKGLNWKNNLAMGVMFTIVSITRQYVLRRWFNSLRFGNVEKA